MGQNLGVVRSLWPEKWQNIYGDTYLSGTFGPNRIVPGMASFFSFVFSIFINYSSIKKMMSLKFNILNFINLLTLPIIIILSSSKTSIITTLIFIIFIFIFINKVHYLFLYTIIFLIFLTILPSKIKERIEFVYEDRFEKYYDKNNLPQDNSSNALIDIYKAQGTGRYEIALKYISELKKNPLILLIGSGINNRALLIGDSSHNMYLSLLGELGIIGFILYLLWLKTLFEKNDTTLSSNYYLNKNEYFLKNIKTSFCISIIISLFFGEHLYIYRTSYGLLGMFLIFIIIFNQLIFYERTNSHCNSLL
ncbi:O-antigen ligase family protein [Thermaurantimonas aggregans]|uniref:O-antigen ligase family protein n=1 Tax=Thermaurantimonas aggregans TaxID=2173829 RepID=UPI0023F3E061|nr:O-antigen ligase family protein [Thermaurantimonas aggregans]MCX8148589.1 O-antigen ligase family protein [Thermaurantimonas aggregans]